MHCSPFYCIVLYICVVTLQLFGIEHNFKPSWIYFKYFVYAVLLFVSNTWFITSNVIKYVRRRGPVGLEYVIKYSPGGVIATTWSLKVWEIWPKFHPIDGKLSYTWILDLNYAYQNCETFSSSMVCLNVTTFTLQ